MVPYVLATMPIDLSGNLHNHLLPGYYSINNNKYLPAPLRPGFEDSKVAASQHLQQHVLKKALKDK